VFVQSSALRFPSANRISREGTDTWDEPSHYPKHGSISTYHVSLITNPRSIMLNTTIASLQAAQPLKSTYQRIHNPRTMVAKLGCAPTFLIKAHISSVFPSLLLSPDFLTMDDRPPRKKEHILPTSSQPCSTRLNPTMPTLPNSSRT
jgi:hypothetical protein